MLKKQLFHEDEKKELKRLLHVAIVNESDRMNLQGVENAVFLIKKIDTINEQIEQLVNEQLQDHTNDNQQESV
jgi:hypothetical protein